MVVELVETLYYEDDPDTGPYPFRSGVTLLIWQEYLDKDGARRAPQIHYVIPKHRTVEREKRQAAHFAMLPPPGGMTNTFISREGRSRDHKAVDAAWQINFGLIHAGL